MPVDLLLRTETQSVVQSVQVRRLRLNRNKDQCGKGR